MFMAPQNRDRFSLVLNCLTKKHKKAARHIRQAAIKHVFKSLNQVNTSSRSLSQNK